MRMFITVLECIKIKLFSKASMNDNGTYTVEIFSNEFFTEKLYIDVQVNVKEITKQLNLPLIIGCSVGIFLLIIIIVIVVTCKCKRNKAETGESSNMHVTGDQHVERTETSLTQDNYVIPPSIYNDTSKQICLLPVLPTRIVKQLVAYLSSSSNFS